MSLFLQIPENKWEWCFQMRPEIFNNEMTYIFYINLKTKELYGKKGCITEYDSTRKFENYHKNINLNNFKKLL